MSQNITVTVTRTLNAPCERVWEVETAPQYFARWFGAIPGSVEVDLRTGGEWRATVAPEGAEIALTGKYVEVVEGRRLVTVFPNGPEDLEVTTTFTDLGETTEVSVSCDVAPEARGIVEETAGSILDKITEILATP